MSSISRRRAHTGQVLYIMWAWNTANSARGRKFSVGTVSAWVALIHTTLDAWTELGHHPRV